MDVGWQPHHTYVPSAPSELHTLMDSVDKILFKLEKLDVQQIGDTVQTLLSSLDRAVADANIPSLSRDMQRILSQDRVTDLILQLSQSLGMTFVIVTHELPSIYAITDRSILLDRETKTIVASGRPEDLRHNQKIPWIYQFFNRQSSATV